MCCKIIAYLYIMYVLYLLSLYIQSIKKYIYEEKLHEVL